MTEAIKVAKFGVDIASDVLKLSNKRRDSKSQRKDLIRESMVVQELQNKEEEILKKQSQTTKGASLARAGSSGVKVSSFEDSFLDFDLKKEQQLELSRFSTASKQQNIRSKLTSLRQDISARHIGFGLDSLSSLLSLGTKETTK